MKTEQFFYGIDVSLNHFNELYPNLQISHENYDSDELNRVFRSFSMNYFSGIYVDIRSMGANDDALVVVFVHVAA